MEMLDEIKVVNVRVPGEFQIACDAFYAAEKAFCKINLSVRLDVSADVCAWFDALEERYLTEKRVWQMFTAGDHLNPRTGRLYLQFREALLHGKSLRADA